MWWPDSRPVGPAGHLGPQVGPVVGGPQGLGHQLAPQVGGGVDLQHGEGHGSADGRRQPAHPVDLLGRVDDVLAGRRPRGPARRRRCPARPGRRRCRRARPRRRRCRAPARRRWRCGRWSATWRSPRAPAATASFTMRLHRGDVLGGGRLVAGTRARPSRRPAPRRGRPGCRRRPSSAAGEGVEVLGEGLPLPRDALGQGRAGDVLDALHQADEPVMTVINSGAFVTRLVKYCCDVSPRTISQHDSPRRSRHRAKQRRLRSQDPPTTPRARRRFAGGRSAELLNRGEPCRRGRYRLGGCGGHAQVSMSTAHRAGRQGFRRGHVPSSSGDRQRQTGGASKACVCGRQTGRFGP